MFSNGEKKIKILSSIYALIYTKKSHDLTIINLNY